MGLTVKKRNDFSVELKTDSTDDCIIFVKGGSVIIDNRWLIINDFKLNVREIISKFVENTSRRLFNNFNDVVYLLIALNKDKQIEILPNISFNKKNYGEVKIFEDLSNKLPIVLVKLYHDGSTDLKAYKPIKKDDLEIYDGYGNFTLQGKIGETGPKGYIGIQGETGVQGITGIDGMEGEMGCTGLPSCVVQGETGLRGAQGVMIPAFLPERN